MKFPSFDCRHDVKAGLTGLAQVMAGYCSCFDSYRAKIALDRLYVQKRSLLLDAWIMLKTVGVILTGSGAR